MADEKKHGEMDISVQENTFSAFVTIVGRAAVVIIVLLIFLALVNS